MGFLIRLYVNALLKGNPFVVIVTIVAVVALSAGPFYQALTSGDSTAIGIALFAAVGLLVVFTVAIIDRKNNAPKGKSGKSKRR